MYPLLMEVSAYNLGSDKKQNIQFIVIFKNEKDMRSHLLNDFEDIPEQLMLNKLYSGYVSKQFPTPIRKVREEELDDYPVIDMTYPQRK